MAFPNPTKSGHQSIGSWESRVAAMSNPHSAATIAGNSDLLIEILQYVPTKSLIKFKTVSKQWLSIISSSHFSRLHTFCHRYTSSSALLLRQSGSSFFLMPLQGGPSRIHALRFNLTTNGNYRSNSMSSFHTTKVLQSCHGLLLLQVCYMGHRKDFYIYNPATRQSRLLQLNFPPCCSSTESKVENHNQSQSKVLGLSLAYDPSKSAHYKVICVRTVAFSDYCYRIEVYESETHSWRAGNGGRDFVFPFDMKMDGIYWNGKIHWIRHKGKSYYFDIDKDSVVLYVGIPFVIPLPRNRREDRGIDSSGCYFGNSNGHLYYVTSCITRYPEGKLLVFEMEADCSKWLLRYQMDFHEILRAFPEMRTKETIHEVYHYYYYSFCVLAMVSGHKDEGVFVVFHVPGKVVAYNFEDQSFAELADLSRVGFPSMGRLQFGLYDACEVAVTLTPI